MARQEFLLTTAALKSTKTQQTQIEASQAARAIANSMDAKVKPRKFSWAIHVKPGECPQQAGKNVGRDFWSVVMDGKPSHRNASPDMKCHGDKSDGVTGPGIIQQPSDYLSQSMMTTTSCETEDQEAQGLKEPRKKKQTITRLRNFECETCSAVFSSRSEWREHLIKIHELEKPFQCDLCPSNFAHISSKYRHVRTVHERRRDFYCNECGMSFGEKCGLTKHQKTVHEGRRPYPCDICNFRFHFKLHLEQHVNTVHLKMKPFVCKVCKNTFGQRSSLNRHCRTFHGHVIKKRTHQRSKMVS